MAAPKKKLTRLELSLLGEECGLLQTPDSLNASRNLGYLAPLPTPEEERIRLRQLPMDVQIQPLPVRARSQGPQGEGQWDH